MGLADASIMKVIAMWETSRMVKEISTVNTIGKMEIYMMDFGKIIIKMDMELFIINSLGNLILGFGRKIKYIT